MALIGRRHQLGTGRVDRVAQAVGGVLYRVHEYLGTPLGDQSWPILAGFAMVLSNYQAATLQSLLVNGRSREHYAALKGLAEYFDIPEAWLRDALTVTGVELVASSRCAGCAAPDYARRAQRRTALGLQLHQQHGRQSRSSRAGRSCPSPSQAGCEGRSCRRSSWCVNAGVKMHRRAGAGASRVRGGD